MRIGIVTQPLTSNYGGILQNYALQEVLRRMGHEPWTVDYNKMPWLLWLRDVRWVAKHKKLGYEAGFLPSPLSIGRGERPLRRFARKYIKLTHPRTWDIDGRIVEKYHFGALVVGSDQIWRMRYNRKVADCFLGFAAGWNIRRIAYAASFGTDEWDVSEELMGVCSALAKRFDGVSVREASGVELCRRHLGVEAAHVLDPTLLLRKEDYCKLCRAIPVRGAFVFAYILDESKEKIDVVRSFAQKKGLPYLVKSAGLNVQPNDTMELWLSCFRDAAFVVTDSFHGVALSINFNKDFYVYANVQRGESRLESLLGVLGLGSRMIASLPENEEPIAWPEVGRKLEAEREMSVRWLRGQVG